MEWQARLSDCEKDGGIERVQGSQAMLGRTSERQVRGKHSVRGRFIERQVRVTDREREGANEGESDGMAGLSDSKSDR